MDVTNEGKQVSMRARVQAFGGFLTNMVLPNIGAFIAWGSRPRCSFQQVGFQMNH